MGGFGKGNTAAASASTEEVSSKGIDAAVLL
jgi:hypothetical protein